MNKECRDLHRRTRSPAHVPIRACTVRQQARASSAPIRCDLPGRRIPGGAAAAAQEYKLTVYCRSETPIATPRSKGSPNLMPVNCLWPPFRRLAAFTREARRPDAVADTATHHIRRPWSGSHPSRGSCLRRGAASCRSFPAARHGAPSRRSKDLSTGRMSRNSLFKTVICWVRSDVLQQPARARVISVSPFPHTVRATSGADQLCRGSLAFCAARAHIFAVR